MYGAALVLETTALLVLRKKEPKLHRPFKIPGGWPTLWLIWVLPVSMVVLLVVLDTIEMGLDSQGLTIAALVSGPVVYALVRAFRRN
jgi:amino acid transporter